MPPLWLAASMGDAESTRALLNAGASPQPSKCSAPSLAWLKPPVTDLLVQHGLDPRITDDRGRNQLHVALAPPSVPPVEGVEHLVQLGVPLNARDQSGKTPLAYWREPREYEQHWFTTWVFERLGDDGTQIERERRARISELLTRLGAML